MASLLKQWGAAGSAPGQFSGPIGGAVGPNGDICVTDSGNNRLHRFRPHGSFVATFGETGSALGQRTRLSGGGLREP